MRAEGILIPLVLLLSFISFIFAATVKSKLFGRCKSVRIDLQSNPEWNRSKNWPEAINFGQSQPMNNYYQNMSSTFSKAITFQNSTNYNDRTFEIAQSAKNSKIAKDRINKKIRRTFHWYSDVLTISINMTSLDIHPTLSRPVPPLSWLISGLSNQESDKSKNTKIRIITDFSKEDNDESIRENINVDSSNTKVASLSVDKQEILKRMQSQQLKKISKKAPGVYDSVINRSQEQRNLPKQSRILEITVPQGQVEESIQALRRRSFTDEDIQRMLDKAPWLLAFDLAQHQHALARLIQDISQVLSPNTSAECFESSGQNISNSKISADVVRVISHCPYLLAQYIRYPGRDVSATAKVLLDKYRYDQRSLVQDLLYFPSILAAPADRLTRWQQLLTWYDIGYDTHGNTLKAFIRKAPFLYFFDAPPIASFASDEENFDSKNQASSEHIVYTTKEDYVLFSARQILDFLKYSVKLPDIDKIVRTDPTLLLNDIAEVKLRVQLLLDVVKRTALKEDLSQYRGYVVNNDERVSKRAVWRSVNQQQHQANSAERLRDIWRVSYENDESGNTVMRGFDIQMNEHCSDTERRALASLVLNNPLILSFPHKTVLEIALLLESHGFTITEIEKLMKVHTILFGRDYLTVQQNILFVRQYCCNSQEEFIRVVLRYPSLLTSELSRMRENLSFLFKALEGNLSALRKFPLFLTFSLEQQISPRVQFMKAMFTQTPLTVISLQQLCQLTDAQFAEFCGSDLTVLKKFTAAIALHNRQLSTLRNLRKRRLQAQ